MEYDKDKIYDKALRAIEKHKLIYMEDVLAFVPCGKTTFYKYFPSGSNKMNNIKRALNESKVNVKVGIRGQWYRGKNATGKIALYKLCATKEELERLNSKTVDVQSKGKELKQFTQEIKLGAGEIYNEEE